MDMHQPTINKEQIFHLSKAVLCQAIDDDTILLDMESEIYFGLNNIGGRILKMLSAGANIETIEESLLKEYNVEKLQLQKDIYSIIQELLDTGLIHTEHKLPEK